MVFDQLKRSELVGLHRSGSLENADVRVLTSSAATQQRRHRRGLQEDLHLLMGTGETRGMLMIAQALLDHVTEEELRREANGLKERQKICEEGQTLRGAGNSNSTARLTSRQTRSRSSQGFFLGGRPSGRRSLSKYLKGPSLTTR